MPGLFGLATLDQRPVDPAAAAALLSAMAERLAHLGNEAVERFADCRHGFAIGRSRPAHLPAPVWPEGSGEAATLFLDGVLHKAPSSHDFRGLDAAQLRAAAGFFTAASHTPGAAGRGRTVLATDYRASRPLVYAVVQGTLYFAPEVKALLAVADLPREADPAACGIFLASGFLLAEQTLFTAVRRLAGGTMLVAADGEIRLETYREHRMSVAGDGTPEEELEEELAHLLRAAVARNYSDPESNALFLSGGRDSRTLLGGALALVDGDAGRVRTVTWTGRDHRADSDETVAGQLAASLGLQQRLVRRSLQRYGAECIRLTYILDGMTDIGVFHPHELEIMQQLAADGVERVLRGDQCFTYGIPGFTNVRQNIMRMCLRCLGDPRGFSTVLRPDVYRTYCEASDAALETLAGAYRDVPPDNVGDEVYFRHRLQGYLNAAGYFKLLLLDHRNPLLDEQLLDFVVRLSIGARRHQAIFRRTVERLYPQLWAQPFAATHNLEDYDILLATDSPVRRFVGRQLADRQSAIWSCFDRDALLRTFDGLAGTHRRRPWTRRLRLGVRDLVRGASSFAPPLQRHLRAAYLRRLSRPDDLFFRFVALKQWMDVCLSGDGSRAAYEAQLAQEVKAAAMARPGEPTPADPRFA